ncbi:hypothetical protein DFR75_103403 [Nocardia ignorata]|uniref:Uncharacterized protein n=1 Tax=Nocardia ignorata TaxID=145285 RepID=A0A4R6PLQ2_NOCIG|nr:hypothetical protein DFR75_103403 [Nocardia ignorata]
MRGKTLLTAVAVISVGYMVLTAPDVLGFVLMVVGAVWLWRSTKRAGMRR